MKTEITFFRQPPIDRHLPYVDEVFKTALAQHAIGQLVSPTNIALLNRNDAIEERVEYTRGGDNLRSMFVLTCRGMFNVQSELGMTWWMATVSVKLGARALEVGPTSEEWTPVHVHIYDVVKRIWSEKVSYLHPYCRHDDSGMAFDTNDAGQGWPDPLDQPFEEMRRVPPKR